MALKAIIITFVLHKNKLAKTYVSADMYAAHGVYVQISYKPIYIYLATLYDLNMGNVTAMTDKLLLIIVIVA